MSARRKGSFVTVEHEQVGDAPVTPVKLSLDDLTIEPELSEI
jgi:hypothetical protein